MACSGANYSMATLVRAAGLEPARDFSQRILSPLRLPLRHARKADMRLVECS